MTQKFDLIDAFSQRPTLRSVALERLSEALAQQFPQMRIDPETCVITRTARTGEQKSETILRNLQQSFLSGKTPRWRTGANTVVLNPAVNAAAVESFDFDALNVLVDCVSSQLIESFQAALADFWSRSAAASQSPWAMVSAVLKQALIEATQNDPALSGAQREVLRAVTGFTEKSQRDFMLGINAGAADDSISVGIASPAPETLAAESAAPVLVISGRLQGSDVFVSWCSPGAVVSFPTLAALELSLSGGGSALTEAAAPVHLTEPDEDVFEVLAQTILEQQLRQLPLIDLTTIEDFADLAQRVDFLTDIATFVWTPTAGVTSPQQLPQWLRSASEADRLDFARAMSALAAVQQRCAGKSYSDDLPPLLDYANQQLQAEISQDHPGDVGLQMTDLDVLIHKVVAAAVPIAGQGTAIGSVEPVRMSVAQFALENLSGQPSGALSLVSRSGSPVPDWFTADYLRLLVCQADVGRRYPALVRKYLITDQAEAARREVLYADQLRVQLPLKALEQKIRHEGGLCRDGYRRVAAIMQVPTAREPALRNTTLRPLAFQARPGAIADVVSNMFVIADRDPMVGPLVLYRPLSAQILSEFDSWSALRAAIVEPGDLQDEVLTWMGDQPRQLYANGGFEQPHSVRFGLGSDFAPLETPAPAQLALDEVAGDPLAALFRANALALVELADRDSVSNAESRWALFKRGGWLALDMVMPFISGVAGTSLWLMQVMDQVADIVSVQDPAAAQERAMAMGNLLLTLAMLLLHQGPRTRGQTPGGNVATVVGPTTAESPRLPASTPQVLDFSWTRPSASLSTSQQAALEQLKINPRPVLATPSQAPGAEGLYTLDDSWYAQIGDAVFKVRISDDGVFVADPQDASRNGPRLTREGQAWRLDLSLRLRGGGPKRNARQIALENAATLKRVIAQKTELGDRQAELYARIVAQDNRLDSLPIDQHAAIIASLETDIKAVIDIIDRKQALDQQLRPADRTSDKANGKDLQGITRRVCLLEGVVLSDMLTLASDDLARMRAVSSKLDADTVDLYVALFQRTLQLQDKGLQWSLVREELWKRLRNVPKVGEEYWRAEALEFYNSRMFAHVEWRPSRLWSSLELCFSAEIILDSRAAVPLKRLLNDDPLHGALTSQAELEKPHDYSVLEQIGVLESSLREYDRASLIALSAFESESELVDKAHFQRFIEDLSAIADRAEHRLSDLIRESEEPPESWTEYVPKAKQARKRVFKTRGQRTLIGSLREGEEPLHGEVVEVKTTGGERVIATYHQHAAGEWVELEAQSPTLVSRESTLPLPELMRRARALLARVEPDIASAVRQSRKANEPEDMEDILTQKADKLRDAIEKLQPHVDDPHAGEGNAQSLNALLAELHAAQVQFREQGRSLRIDMIKRQPPTASRINYLQRQGEVNIASIDGRKNMSGAKRNDFLQEYAVRDKDNRILWWAHFHYASEAASADAFTAAHLKLPAQRFLGYKALLKAAKDNKEVVSIYRSGIGKELAQRLFLHLAPEALNH